MDRAISLGVRCRLAPSTRAIIRSRKRLARVGRDADDELVADHGRAAGDGAERMSVPGSLSTGADSPVMAASLTKPTPSMTSPSPGIVSPSRTTMRSPLRSSDEPTSSSVPSARRRWAVVSDRVRRRRGRLGPAARLGEGLGVGREQDREPQPGGDLDLEARRPARRLRRGRRPSPSRTTSRVTRTAVISTTKMTGLRTQPARDRACGRPRGARRAAGPGRGCRGGRAAASPRAGLPAAQVVALEAPGAAAEVEVSTWTSVIRRPSRPSSRSCSAIGPRASAGK